VGINKKKNLAKLWQRVLRSDNYGEHAKRERPAELEKCQNVRFIAVACLLASVFGLLASVCSLLPESSSSGLSLC